MSTFASSATGTFRRCGFPCEPGAISLEHDRLGAPKVAIVNESLARKLWPGQDPIGPQLLYPDPSTGVGVVGDGRHLALEKDGGFELYGPIRQTGDFGSGDIVVRAKIPRRWRVRYARRWCR